MVYVVPHEKLTDTNQTRSKYNSQENIFNSIKFFMVFCQVLGLLPQENITTTQNQVHFKWKSWKVLYTVFLIGMTIFALVVCFLDGLYSGYVFTALATNIFYAGALVTLILYLRLARSWSKLILLWCRVDRMMNSVYDYPKSLNKRLYIVASVYLTLGLVDHGLSVLNKYNNMYKLYGDAYTAETFYRESFPQLFRFVAFNPVSATVCCFLQVHATLTWITSDIFIILLSIALALRFKQISERLINEQKNIKSYDFWIEIREDYDRLSVLCKELDKHISYITLLSFSINIFLLLVQLYHSLETVHGFIGQTYFIFSFMHIITKIVSVSLYAAWVNDESLEPADILNSVPVSAYNTEVFTECRSFNKQPRVLIEFYTTMKIIKKNKSEVSVNLELDKPLAFHQNGFHENIRFVIIMAQFFGVMPLHNIRESIHEVKFKWKSFRLTYSVYNTVATFVNSVFWVTKFAVDGLVVDETAQMAFYVCNCFASIQLIQIARHWSHILREWSFVELSMRGYGYQVNLKKTFVVLASLFMGVGLVEHMLFILNSVYQAKNCKGYDEAPFKYFFGVSFPNIFTLVVYDHWIGFIVKFFNTTATFTWIYTDLLITLISIGLTARFKQIVWRLENNKVMHEKFWKEIRQDYHRLYHLSKTVEKHIALLVLISYIHNIFFLCIQLYNSIGERSGIIESVYFFFSFGFLVLRLLAVSMYGAWLNDEARKPLEFLYAVPSEHYCTEINRLIEQIYTNPVGITGSGFFLVTKNFLLQMAGTIVTFELMIFQFAPVAKYQPNVNTTYNCNLR
ncbi:hypothetical protein NQ315_008191 [Exocentrus adspersus]|uniref:Gustatory receptor n=1 Tax=Exocentrus adspersus TaxID=1586481 RepID=A0AAV8VVX5_9CUCU|nr:hypothetical protein NQ315_008191 [Exocentrus adspersus]